MKRKWYVLFLLALALTLVIPTSLTALAQDRPVADSTTDATRPPALGIQAPRIAPPGDVTITVFERGSQDPVKDAAVWAITRDNAEAFRDEVF